MSEKKLSEAIKSQKEDKQEKPKEKKGSLAGVKALKDHVLYAPPHVDPAMHIKEGDDLGAIPEAFVNSMIVEGVAPKKK